MSLEIKGYIFAVLYGILCLALSVGLHFLGVEKKYCRKVVHILVGFEWVILYNFMGASIHFLIVCLAFLLLLLLIYVKDLMPMLSSDGENAPGTVYYCVAMSLMAFICLFVPNMMLPFGVGVFCTSFGDGFAGWIGQSVKRFNPTVYRNKSLMGAFANFVFSFLSAFVFTNVFDMGLSLWECFLIAFFSVQLELIGFYGLDNIFITAGVAFLTYSFVYLPIINTFIAPIILTPLVIMLSIEKKALTTKGLIFALILDVVISLTLGNYGFILLLSFLVGSIIIDKIKALRKMSDTITKRGDCRDEVQVVANGLIPMILAVFYACTMNPVFIVAYAAVLCEAFSDTVASGMGVYSKNTFDIFRLRKCECGLSGGVSAIGTLSSLLGAILFTLIVIPFGISNIYVLIVIALSAFAGVIFDSFLGSLFQVKYKCTVCASLTERENHCDKPTKKFSGFRFFDNDVVNIMSAIFSGAVAILLFNVFT